MKKKKKRRRLNYFRVGLALLLLFLIVFLIVFFIRRSRTTEDSVIKLEYGELSISGDFTALILRNEKVFYSLSSGDATYAVNEGDTLEKGDVVLKIALVDEVAETDSRTSDEVVLSISRRALEIELDELRKEVLKDINYRRYSSAIEKKREYKAKKELLEKIGDSSTANEVAQEVQIAKNEVSVHTSLRGRISFTVDGYETPASLSNIYTFDFSKMGSYLQKSSVLSTTIAKGDPIYKIIDDSGFYIAIRVPYSMNPDMYKGAEHFMVSIDGIQVEGKLYDSFEQGDASICIIRLNEAFPSFYTSREQFCNVTLGGYKGLIVPNEALTTQNGTRGVFKVTPEKRVEFIAVKVLKEGPKNAIIQNGRFYNISGDLTPTVEVGQVIVKNALGYKTGDFVKE